jgi:DNA topoisomerase IB
VTTRPRRVRLRRSRAGDPGLTRRRAGRGWVYLDTEGARVTDPEVVARCDALAVPPAWTEVWICPWPNGHLQAVGTDEAGRRQYRYHEQWRRDRDAEKHDRVLEVASRLPDARRRVAADLARDGMPRERVLAAAFRLLDQGLFRVGGEAYAESNGSYGLATLRREHVRVTAGGIRFDYVAKSGRDRSLVLDDPEVAGILRTLKRRRDDSPELLAWRDGGGRPAVWRDVTSTDVNAYVHDVVGGDMTAKDFRTWHATVLAAVALAEAGAPGSATARRRAVAAAVREVAEYLGNTPAVAKASYVDARVIDRWEDGVTLAPVLAGLGADGRPETEPWSRAAATREAIERAVLDLLTLPPERARQALRRRSRRRGARGLAAA